MREQQTTTTIAEKLSPTQFEMLGIFCDYISKEISMLYDIGEFLSIR